MRSPELEAAPGRAGFTPHGQDEHEPARSSSDAYGKNEAPQCDLPGHGHVWAHQPPAEQRSQARYYGDPRRWSVLCDSSSWEVQMDVGVVKEIKTSRSLRGKKPNKTF